MTMKEILETSIKSAGLSEVEVAAWVTDLRRYHAEEARRQEQRLEQLNVLEASHNLVVNNFKIAQENLEREHQFLSKERAHLAQLVEGMKKERDALVRERVRLEERRKDLEPDFGTKVLFAFMGGMAALLLLLLLWWLGEVMPVFVGWVRGFF